MELTKEHQDWAKMMAHAIRRRWSKVPLDDLYQEALIRLWRLLQVYDPSLNDSWKGFAQKTVYQHLWKRCEQWSRWEKRNTTGHENTPDSSAWDPDPEPSEASTSAEKLLGMLSAKHQYVLRQSILEERTLADIAADSSVSIAYIHQLHAEALAELRRIARYMGLPVCFQPETTPPRRSEHSEITPDSAPQLSLFETKKG